MPRPDAPLGAPGDDPFASPLDDRGFRAGARLEVPAAGRTRRWATVLAIVVLVGAFTAALEPSTPSTGPDVAGPDRPAGPTPLPRVARLDGARTLDPFAVVMGGLRWVDPETGTVTSDPYRADRGAFLVGRDGAVLCVCPERPWRDGEVVERVAIARYDPTGRELARGVAETLTAAVPSGRRDPIRTDVAVDPAGTHLHLARIVFDGTAWTLGLDTIRLADLAVTARLDLGAVEAWSRILSPVLRVSPDGRRLHLAVRWWVAEDEAGRPAGPGAWFERTWLLDVAAGSASVTVARADEARPSDVPDRCDGEAWATDDRYVLVCRRIAQDTIVPFVRIETLQGEVTDVAMGDPVGRDDIDWLLDRASGTLVRWSPWSHVLVRMDLGAADPAAIAVTVDPATGTVSGLVETSAPPRLGNPRRGASWTVLTSAADRPERRHLAASTTGVLYAIGFRSTGAGDPNLGEGVGSSGIWVFDGATFGLIGHWVPVSRYDTIGVTPGGHVVAGGTPGVAPDGAPARWPASLVVLDDSRGRVLAILGDISGSSGFRPVFLRVDDW